MTALLTPPAARSPVTQEGPALDLTVVNANLADAPAVEVVRWAADAFGDGLILTSSFGAQSAVMLHLVTRVVPDVPVVLIDTGYLFPETYRFVRSLKDQLKLNLKVYTPRMTSAWMESMHGKLWEQGGVGLDRYHRIVKVEPMQRALEDLGTTAWLAGLRAEQTDHRATLRKVETDDGRYKVHPILDWSNRDVHMYLKEHDLPYHPLFHKGYQSIGDTHSTRPITGKMSARDGRFNGVKQECGLHLPKSLAEDDSLRSSGL